MSLSERFDAGITELRLRAFGFLILAAISARLSFAPTWVRSGPVAPPLPPILWQPVQPSEFTNPLPFVMRAALLPADFLAALFFFAAAPTALVPADKPIAAATPHAVMAPQYRFSIVAPCEKTGRQT